MQQRCYPSGESNKIKRVQKGEWKNGEENTRLNATVAALNQMPGIFALYALQKQ